MASDEDDEANGRSENNAKITCNFCNIGIRSGTVRCKGQKCLVVLHVRCFESVARLFAIVDKKDWLCKTCSSKSEGEAAAQSTDVKLLQKENDYLMREKWLQDKLILTLEVCNKQLQDKLEDSKNLHQGSSYSAVVKNRTVNKTTLSAVLIPTKTHASTADIIIKQDGSGDANDKVALNNIPSIVNPTKLNVKIDHTKFTKNGIVIRCNDETSRSLLKNNLQEGLGQGYTIQDAHKWNPRLIIKGVSSKLVEDVPVDQLIDGIVTLNNLREVSDEITVPDIKLITTLKSGNTRNLVLETNSTTRRKMLAAGRVFVGWQSCTCDDYIRVIKCYKCSRFGHTQKNCTKANPSYSKCAQNHKTRNCNIKDWKCITCIESNAKFKTSFLTNHYCGDHDNCATYSKQIAMLQSRIDYGQT
jgi:uncharacterized protein YerC